MSREVCGICWCPYDEDTGECACEPEPKKQHMTTLRTAAQQALEALERLYNDTEIMVTQDQHRVMKGAITALRAALAEPALQTCNCRWDGEVQVQQCTLHEAHVDAIHEWAQRAKFAEKKLTALAEPVQEPVAQLHPDHFKPNPDGTEWCREVLLYSPNNEGDKLSGVNTRVKLYAAPPQRKPLTKEEIDSIWDSEKAFADIYAIVRAIERAHNIT